jgi:hypothetical protein
MSNGNFMHRPLAEWTLAELVQYNQADILMSIPKDGFNGAVAAAANRVLMWKEERSKEPK